MFFPSGRDFTLTQMETKADKKKKNLNKCGFDTSALLKTTFGYRFFLTSRLEL